MENEYSVINFRVTPDERKQLRIILIQEGVTLQDFFAQIVKDKLAENHAEILVPAT